MSVWAILYWEEKHSKNTIQLLVFERFVNLFPFFNVSGQPSPYMVSFFINRRIKISHSAFTLRLQRRNRNWIMKSNISLGSYQASYRTFECLMFSWSQRILQGYFLAMRKGTSKISVSPSIVSICAFLSLIKRPCVIY